MLLVLCLHLGAALAAPVLARYLGPRTFLLLALVPAAGLGLVLVELPGVLDGRPVLEELGWAATLDLAVPLRLDPLSLLLALLVTGVGALVLVYARWYFADAREGLGRNAGVLVGFAGAMLGLVLVDHVLGLYLFWELTTVCSFLLIGGDGRDAEARSAAARALLVTVAGGFAMLLGFLLLADEAGTYLLSELVANPPTGPVAAAGVVLVLLGAATKSGLVPFHTWLPLAMVAPTPVSAYLHAAAMVKAGVYLVARLAPGFADATALWKPVVLTVGLVTMVLAAWRALAQTDLKRLLAFGTVSELGLLTVLLGAGTRTAALAGATMLLAHGLFKATLFMVVGVVDHRAGSRDLRELSGLRTRAPVLLAVTLLAAASMAGLPPLLGFVGKEAAYEAFVHGGWDAVVLAGLVVGSVLTVAYAARFVWGAFADRPGVRTPWASAPRSFTAPSALLALGGLALGLAAPAADGLAAPYADRLPSATGGEPYHLALWHGLTPVLGLSVLTVLAGLGVHALRGPLAGRAGRLPGSARAVEDSLARRVDRVAVQVTARTAVGSLPLYLAVIFGTLVLVPGTALLLAADVGGSLRPWDTPVQAVLGAGVLVACVGTIVAPTRLSAVLVASAAGYLVAALFVVHGAPDLALTQVLIESLTLVVFVFVVRHMPRELPRSPGWAPRTVRVTVSVLVGGFMTLAALVTGAAHRPSDISAGLFARASEAGGHNVVNLVLVDFRALDTFGEIAVLATAATGVASLVLVDRRTGGPPRRGGRWRRRGTGADA